MSGRVTRWLGEKRLTIFSLLAVDRATSCDVTLIEGCHQQIFIPFQDSQTSNTLQQTMMMHSRLSLTAILMLTSTASAFAPSRNQGKASFVTLSETPHSLEFLRENFQKAIGIAILGSVLAFHVPPASAYLSPHGKQESCSRLSVVYAIQIDWRASVKDNSLPSIQLSEAIKTLDFSLPSYDKIASSKASVANVDGLAVEPLEQDDPKPVKVVKAKKVPQNEGEPRSTGSGVMTNFLPSMSKKGPLVAATTRAPKEKKVDAPPRKTAAESIEEKKQEKITILDMSLPSYQDSTAVKEKSAFAF